MPKIHRTRAKRLTWVILIRLNCGGNLKTASAIILPSWFIFNEPAMVYHSSPDGSTILPRQPITPCLSGTAAHINDEH